MRGVKHIHAPAAHVELVVQPAVKMVQPEIRIESADRIKRLHPQQRRRVERARFPRGHPGKRCRHWRVAGQPHIRGRQQPRAFRQDGAQSRRYANLALRRRAVPARACRKRNSAGSAVSWIERQQPVVAFLPASWRAPLPTRGEGARLRTRCGCAGEAPPVGVVSEALRQLLRAAVTRRLLS